MSHLLREMWIEIPRQSPSGSGLMSHLLREMWIEIVKYVIDAVYYKESSPAGDVA